MNVISKFIVIVTIIGLEAGLGFLAYLLFSKINNVRTMESEQQEKYIEQPFLYLAFGLIVLCMLMSIFLACGLWNAAKVLEKSLLVVKKMIAKVFPVLVIPIIMIAVSIGVLIYYAYVIILHSAGSSFNASRIVWTLLYYEDGKLKHDLVKTLLFALYVMLCVQLLFLIIIINTYVISINVIKRYFEISKSTPCKNFGHGLVMFFK